MHAALNPSLAFKGTSSIVSGSASTSRLYTCIVTSQRYIQNCDFGHVSSDQCSSPSCCNKCWYYSDYSSISTCDDGSIPGGGPITNPTEPTDGGASGFEVNYTEFDTADLNNFKNNSAFGNKYKLWFNSPQNQSASLQLFLYYQYNNYKPNIFDGIKKYIDFAIAGQSTLFTSFNTEWVMNFITESPNITWQQFQKWFIKGNLDFQNVADVEFAKDLSNLSYDLLIANQNGTLNQLQTSWPNWQKIKQKIKASIAQGTHQTAKIVKTYYDEMSSNPYINNAASRVIINMYIDELRNEIKQTTNMNKDTMNWDDLFKIWLFELMPNPYSSINFTWNSNVINGNNLYNSSTNAVFNFPKGSPSMINDIKNGLINGTFNIGNNMSKYFQYNFTQYYATLSNNNIGIQMLGKLLLFQNQIIQL